MEHGRRRRPSTRLALAAAATASLAVAGLLSCESDTRGLISPTRQPLSPTYAAGGVTGATCDIDLIINVGIDSAGLRPGRAATYNLHVNASSLGGTPAVTATVDQIPGVVLNLLSSPLGQAVPFQSPGPNSTQPLDISAFPLPTQATIDSLTQKPIDGFCYVARDASGIAMAPSAVGSQGSTVQTANYANSVAAAVTSDVATGLVTQEVITVAGVAVRETHYTFSSAGTALYRSMMTSSSTYTVAGQRVPIMVQMSVRNLVRTSGGQ